MNIRKIIVHPGRYQIDELVAIVVLRILFPFTATVPLVRMRPTEDDLADPEVFVIDCGEVYNPDRNNFDHHQDKTLPCSARMIWNHFYPEENPLIKRTMDISFFRSIDRHDTGVLFAGGNSLSSVVSSMNESAVPFDEALAFVDKAFRSLLTRCEKVIPIRTYWYSGTTFGGCTAFKIFPKYCSVTIRGELMKYASEKKGALYLIWPITDDGKHIVYSLLEDRPIPKDRRQIENDSVAAVYNNKKDAIDHVLELGVKALQKRSDRKKRLKAVA